MILGGFAFWLWGVPSDVFWFALGSLMSLGNLALSAFVLRLGFQSAGRQALALGLVLGKSIVFLAAVAVMLFFFKASFLPFTAGVLLVIFSLVIWAIGHSLAAKRKSFEDCSS